MREDRPRVLLGRELEPEPDSFARGVGPIGCDQDRVHCGASFVVAPIVGPAGGSGIGPLADPPRGELRSARRLLVRS